MRKIEDITEIIIELRKKIENNVGFDKARKYCTSKQCEKGFYKGDEN